MIGAIVLAAGAGRRFGGAAGGKLLAPLDGKPVLEHVVELARAAPVERVVVALGAGAAEVRAIADLGEAEAVECPDWAEGQAASLRCAVAALGPGADAALVLLGDQPRIAPAAVTGVLRARDPAAADAVRATWGGVPGHPVLLERVLLARVPSLRGDIGARGLLAGARVCEVTCDGLGDPTDVDTPQTLLALARRGSVAKSLCR